MLLDKQTLTLITLVVTHLLALVGPPVPSITPGPSLSFSSALPAVCSPEPCISNCTCACQFPVEHFYVVTFFLGFGASSVLWIGFVTGIAWARRRGSATREVAQVTSRKALIESPSGDSGRRGIDSSLPSLPSSRSSADSDSVGVDVAAVARAQLALVRSRR
jgi:hypothetical protein